MFDLILTHWNYMVVVLLMCIGLYMVISRHNLVKKLIGLAIFQTSLFLLYISLGWVEGGTAPIIMKKTSEAVLYANPLPHVLILTAIVVGVATTALGLSLVLKIHDAFGSIEEDDLLTEKRSDRHEDKLASVGEEEEEVS